VFAQLQVPTVVNLKTVNARSVVVVGVEHAPIELIETTFESVPEVFVAVTV
jgi:hypothetical protein